MTRRTNSYTSILGEAERVELYDAFLEGHGGQSFVSRTTAEINIFFDGNYYVADGSHDVIVEPFEECKKQ